MHRLLLACLLALLLTASPRLAGAAMMRHHDLASLVLDSEAIVLARRGAVEPRQYYNLTHHEILKVYRGSLTVGDDLAVSTDGYLLSRDPWGVDDGTAAAMSDQVVLFVRHHQRDRDWRLTASGLRILVDGRVLRFEQHNNPGPYVPVDQRRDPYDVMADPRADVPVDLATFEQDLAAAIRHADIVRQALRTADTDAGKHRLLDLVGPAPGTWDDRPCAPEHGIGFYDDRVTTTILEALARTGDLTTTLAGIARIRGGVDLFMFERTFSPADLLAFAAADAHPLPSRVAALDLLAEELGAGKDPTIVAGAARLLSDPDPAVRAATARLSFETDAWKTAILAAFTAETDSTVRYHLGVRADALEIFARLRLRTSEKAARLDRTPLLAVTRRCRWLELRWLPAWHADELALHIQEPGAPPRRQVLASRKTSDHAMWSWTNGTSTGLEVLLPIEPKPGAPNLDLVAELHLTLDQPRAQQTLRIPLPSLTAVATPTFADPPVPAATTPPEPPRSAPPPPPSAPPHAAAPGCTTTSATPPLALLLLTLRRRRPTH